MLKAIKEGDEEALTAMIKAGKNLSEPNKEGWLPLHEAAYYGQLNCLKALHRGEAVGRAGGHRWDWAPWVVALSFWSFGPRQPWSPGARPRYHPALQS